MNKIFFDTQFDQALKLHWMSTKLPAELLPVLANEVYRRANAGESVFTVSGLLADHFTKTKELKIERKKGKR